MTRRRDNSYLWVTWLAEVMAGDASCTWAAWFRAHFTGYSKAPSDFNLAIWTAQHTRMLSDLAAEKLAAHETIWQENQCFFRVRLRPSLTIAGKPDLVALSERSCVVYDATTGKRRHKDVIQVMLYMCCLPFAFPALRGKQIDGCVTYAEGEPVWIPAEAIDSAFKRNAAYYVDLLAADTVPPRVPSAQECRFCDISGADCPSRIEWHGPDIVREDAPIWVCEPIAA